MYGTLELHPVYSRGRSIQTMPAGLSKIQAENSNTTKIDPEMSCHEVNHIIL